MRLFISYSRTDSPFPERLHEHLNSWGYEARFDKDLDGGEHWWPALLEEIETSDIFICVISARAVTSEPCILERKYALGLNKRVLPIKLDRTQMPDELKPRNYLDKTILSDEEFEKRLIDSINNFRDTISSRPRTKPSPKAMKSLLAEIEKLPIRHHFDTAHTAHDLLDRIIKNEAFTWGIRWRAWTIRFRFFHRTELTLIVLAMMLLLGVIMGILLGMGDDPSITQVDNTEAVTATTTTMTPMPSHTSTVTRQPATPRPTLTQIVLGIPATPHNVAPNANRALMLSILEDNIVEIFNAGGIENLNDWRLCDQTNDCYVFDATFISNEGVVRVHRNAVTGMEHQWEREAWQKGDMIYLIDPRFLIHAYIMVN